MKLAENAAPSISDIVQGNCNENCCRCRCSHVVLVIYIAISTRGRSLGLHLVMCVSQLKFFRHRCRT